MLTLIMLRHAELEVLVKLGVYKNVENMTDKEMFSEYDKLKKQSMKLQKRIRKANKKTRSAHGGQKDIRLSLNQDDAESDMQSTADDRESTNVEDLGINIAPGR